MRFLISKVLLDKILKNVVDEDRKLPGRAAWIRYSVPSAPRYQNIAEPGSF
jgi:predicted RNA-binding protein YlxR (DUF448 family)